MQAKPVGGALLLLLLATGPTLLPAAAAEGPLVTPNAGREVRRIGEDAEDPACVPPEGPHTEPDVRWCTKLVARGPCEGVYIEEVKETKTGFISWIALYLAEGKVGFMITHEEVTRTSKSYTELSCEGTWALEVVTWGGPTLLREVMLQHEADGTTYTSNPGETEECGYVSGLTSCPLGIGGEWSIEARLPGRYLGPVEVCAGGILRNEAFPDLDLLGKFVDRKLSTWACDDVPVVGADAAVLTDTAYALAGTGVAVANRTVSDVT